MTSGRRTTPLARACAEPHGCPRPLRLDVLAHTPYFSGLDRDQIGAIDDRMVVRAYEEDEVVYRHGEEATGLYILATGKVKVSRPGLDGFDVVVDVITPGAIFGSAAALGLARHPDTAEALTVSCALWIPAADFRRVLREHPLVALAVLDDVATRLEEAQESVRRLSGGSVDQRVAATLLTLADKVGEPHDGATLLQLPLTRGDLAAMTGTTTESVSRALSRFRRAGLVETGRRWTSVVDHEGLAAVAHGTP